MNKFITRPLTCLISFMLCSFSVVAQQNGDPECNFISTGDNNQIMGIAIDSNNVVYAVNKAVCKSIDGGKTWQLLSDPSEGLLTTITIDKYDHVYLGAEHQMGAGESLFKTTDGGNFWKNVSEADTWRIDQIITNSLGQVFTIGSGSESDINISRDGGDTWEYVSGIDSDQLLIDNNDHIYSFGYPYSKSINNGRTWFEISRPSSGVFNSTAVNNDNHIFIGDEDGMTPEGLFRSVDGGDSWERILGEDTLLIEAISIDKNNNDIYVGATFHATGEASVFKSTDNGNTWKELDIPEVFHINEIAIDSNSHVYLGTSQFYNEGKNYFFKSEDGGNTWLALGGLSK